MLSCNQARRSFIIGYLQFIEDTLQIRWRTTGTQLFNAEIKKPPKGHHHPLRGFTLAPSGNSTFS